MVSSLSSFGSRRLEDKSRIFDHNAWDNAEWTPEQLSAAQSTLEAHLQAACPSDVPFKQPAQHWDSFYTRNTSNFFKDRHWLPNEFPVLFKPATQTVFEVGCGVGNTVWPLLDQRKHESIKVYACDYSRIAIQVLKDSEKYETYKEKCQAFVADVTEESFVERYGLNENMFDVITLVFVLSAIHPKHYHQVFATLRALLKPGGQILFRDYGQYDLTQLRFRGKHLVDADAMVYTRGDSTLVHFFTEDEIKRLVEASELAVQDIGVDQRVLTNRGRGLVMYRVWYQGSFRKPAT